MKLQSIAKLLSNRINQEHYVLHHLQEVYNAGIRKGRGIPNPKEEKEGIYQQIIDHFGEQEQVNKIQEEAMELALALHQYKCITKDPIVHMDKIYDELADVTIMMKQARLLFNPKRIDRRVEEKLQKCCEKYLTPTDSETSKP